jgi:uncharacterized caspase-like protein
MSSNEYRPPREDNFGTRYLKEEHDVYEHNAWDNVDFTKEKEAEIKEILARQRLTPVDVDQLSALLGNPSTSWNSFYEKNEDRFFKDRKWITKEFPELLQEPEDKVCSFPISSTKLII